MQELTLNKYLIMFTCGSREFSRVEIQDACHWAQVNAGTISRFLDASSRFNCSTVHFKQDIVRRTVDDVHSLIRMRESRTNTNGIFNLARRAKATDSRNKVMVCWVCFHAL